MNELLLGVEAAISTIFVLLAWRLAKKRFFYGVILTFLLLIVIFGAKTSVFFGHETNIGNIFYGAIYLATYFFIERQGERDTSQSVWASVIGVAFFFVLAQITISLSSTGNGNFGTTLTEAFAPFSQLTSASLIAYVISQSLNIRLYAFLKARKTGATLWARTNTCNVIAQIVDSAIFFTIAFWGLAAPANILDIMLTGFIIKVSFVALTSPLLYLNRIEQDEGRDFSTISVR